MLVVALDPSSTNCGWALFRGNVLMNHGSVKRVNISLTDYARNVAVEIREAVSAYPGESHIEVYYEINDGAPIARGRQKSMRKQAQGTGRILQALGVDGKEMQADNRKKKVRAQQTSMIYEVQNTPANEHRLDAIALGHRVVNSEGHLAYSVRYKKPFRQYTPTKPRARRKA